MYPFTGSEVRGSNVQGSPKISTKVTLTVSAEPVMPKFRTTPTASLPFAVSSRHTSSGVAYAQG
jgi:hypothetical protein